MFSVCYVQAQKESDIIAKFRKALLRSAVLNDVTTISKGTTTIGQVGLEYLLYFDKGKMRNEMNISGMKVLMVQNDSIRWSYNSLDKSHRIEHLSKQKLQEERALNKSLDYSSRDLLDYKERGHKLKNLGVVKIDSIDSYHLQVLRESKPSIDFYLNTKTFLIYKVQMGTDIRVYARYGRFGEYIYPTYIYGNQGDQLVLFEVTDVTLETPMPPGTFDIPAEAYEYEKKRGDELELMLKSAEGLYAKGENEKAITEFTEVIRKHGRIYRAFNGRGLSKSASKKYYEAVSDFNEALFVVPNNAVTLNNRGLAKQYVGDVKGAYEDFAAAIASDSTLAIAYRNRALLSMNTEKYEDAVGDFARVISLQPDGEAYFHHGLALVSVGQVNEGILDYNKSKSLGVERTATFYNYVGVAHFVIEQYDTAVVYFKSAIGIDKNNTTYVKNLGDALYRTGSFSDAQKQYENFLTLEKDNAEVYNMIGLCRYQEEDYKGAIQRFTKAIELDPKSSTYFDNRASAKGQTHDFEGAISDFSQSITLYPNDAEIFFRRGMLKIETSKKLEGCMDLGTANEMKHEGAKEAIRKNCN